MHIGPENKTVSIYNSVNLFCRAESILDNDKPEINWKKNNQVLQTSKRIKIHQNRQEKSQKNVQSSRLEIFGEYSFSLK